jgi:hypothetical protein
MRDILDDKAELQDISDTLYDSIPQQLLSNSPSSGDQDGHSPMEGLSVSTRGGTDYEERGDAPFNNLQRRSPDPIEPSSDSSHMSIRSSPSAHHKESSGPSDPIYTGLDDSSLSDDSDLDSESSYFTESSDGANKIFVHSLEELGRGRAPELALAMEATKRAMMELLHFLADPPGLSTHDVKITSCAEESGPSGYSGPGRGYSQGTEKVPQENGGNGRRKKGDVGDDNTEEDGSEDGGRDDGSKAGKASILPDDHCPCCRFKSYAPGKAPSNPFSTRAQATTSLRFACPFFKHNPEKNPNSACRGPGWAKVSRIK